jgi:hypothetical protein
MPSRLASSLSLAADRIRKAEGESHNGGFAGFVGRQNHFQLVVELWAISNLANTAWLSARRRPQEQPVLNSHNLTFPTDKHLRMIAGSMQCRSVAPLQCRSATSTRTLPWRSQLGTSTAPRQLLERGVPTPRNLQVVRASGGNVRRRYLLLVALFAGHLLRRRETV